MNKGPAYARCAQLENTGLQKASVWIVLKERLVMKGQKAARSVQLEDTVGEEANA